MTNESNINKTEHNYLRPIFYFAVYHILWIKFCCTWTRSHKMHAVDWMTVHKVGIHQIQKTEFVYPHARQINPFKLCSKLSDPSVILSFRYCQNC